MDVVLRQRFRSFKKKEKFYFFLIVPCSLFIFHYLDTFADVVDHNNFDSESSNPFVVVLFLIAAALIALPIVGLVIKNKFVVLSHAIVSVLLLIVTIVVLETDLCNHDLVPHLSTSQKSTFKIAVLGFLALHSASSIFAIFIFRNYRTLELETQAGQVDRETFSI